MILLCRRFWLCQRRVYFFNRRMLYTFFFQRLCCDCFNEMKQRFSINDCTIILPNHLGAVSSTLIFPQPHPAWWKYLRHRGRKQIFSILTKQSSKTSSLTDVARRSVVWWRSRQAILIVTSQQTKTKNFITCWFLFALFGLQKKRYAPVKDSYTFFPAVSVSSRVNTTIFTHEQHVFEAVRDTRLFLPYQY